MNKLKLKELIREEVVSVLKESGLSRIELHVKEHDCAIITAFRNDPRDRSVCVDDVSDEYSDNPDLSIRDINKLRNRDLKAVLLRAGCGITLVQGSFVENFEQPEAVEVREDSLFVVNLKDRADFLDIIRSLGERYCQDSVLYIPRGGRGSRLVGTNRSEYPGYGNDISVGDLRLGSKSEFMTRVGGRPFVFKENLETYESKSRLERLAISALARRFNV